MDNKKAYEMFKRIYPEKEITCYPKEIDDKHSLVTSDFPDGRFYFIVTKNTVSSSYDSEEKAMKSISPKSRDYER